MTRLLVYILLILSNMSMQAQNSCIAKKKQSNPDYYVGQFYEGIAKYTEDGENYGFINEQGQIIVEPFSLGKFCSNFIGGYSMLCTRNEWIVYDKTGKQTVIFRNDNENNFLNYGFSFFIERHRWEARKIPRTQGYFVIPKIIDGEQKYYYLNDKLERLSDLYFDMAHDFVEDYAMVKHKGRWGILNTKGELFETDYNHITPVENGTFIVHKKISEFNVEHGVINAKGDTLIPIGSYYITYLFDDLYRINIGFMTPFEERQYVVDINNRELLSQRCFNINKFSDNIGVCFVLTGAINLDAGRILSRMNEFRFSGYIYFFDKNGFINEEGIYMEYTGALNSVMTGVGDLFGTNGCLSVKKDGQKYTINRRGEIIKR